MKILMLGWELPPHMSGGLGTACDGLLAGLQHVGATQTTFILPRLTGGEQGHGAHLIAVDKGAGAMATGTTAAYGRTIGSDVQWFADHVGQASAGVDFDLIHAHDWLTVPAALELQRRSGKPLCLHIHSTEIDRSGPGASAAILAIERAGMHAADRILTVSEATRRQLIEQFGVHADKVGVIYNGVHFDNWPARRPRAADDAPLAVFIGRITHQKGPHYFVRAAQHVRARHPDLRCVVAGVGDMLESTIDLACELGMRDCFTFPGFLDRDGVRALFARADVFVMPSLSEPFGIVALEAIAASVPVVMSRRAGVAEVVASAHKIDPWDSEGIAAAMDAVLSDPIGAADMAGQARREAAAWDWPQAAQLLASHYAEQIGQAAGAEQARRDALLDAA